MIVERLNAEKAPESVNMLLNSEKLKFSEQTESKFLCLVYHLRICHDGTRHTVDIRVSLKLCDHISYGIPLQNAIAVYMDHIFAKAVEKSKIQCFRLTLL